MPDFRLLMMRHGQAESYSADGDAGRRLTSDGFAKIQRAAAALSLMVTVDTFLTLETLVALSHLSED